MGLKFKTFLLTVLLAIAFWAISSAVGETAGDGAMPATAEVAAATSQPAATQATGPVVDPAVELPRVMDKTQFPPAKAGVPTLFLCGDSTMDSRPNGKEPLVNNFRARLGWGGSVIPYFDTDRINVENHAKGGTSTRTFMNEGYWQAILPRLKAGDFVVLEFGHNDSSELEGPSFRGTIRSIGQETKEVVNKAGQREIVHTYGWYLRRFISDTESKGATAIVLSPVPRNYWKDKTTFNNVMLEYAQMAKEVADGAHVQYIDMDAALAGQYGPMGQDEVTKDFFTSLDKTHTSPAGAKNVARVFVGELRKSDCGLKNYLVDSPVVPEVSPMGVGE